MHACIVFETHSHAMSLDYRCNDWNLFNYQIHIVLICEHSNLDTASTNRLDQQGNHAVNQLGSHHISLVKSLTAPQKLAEKAQTKQVTYFSRRDCI